MSDAPFIIHATTVAVDARALAIRGATGTGKSGLALQMIALGATLVADDRTVVTPCAEGGLPIVSAPPAIAGRIEARGLGILSVPSRRARLGAILDLDEAEIHRLPPGRFETLGGARLPLLHKVEGPHFPAALFAYLQGERTDP